LGPRLQIRSADLLCILCYRKSNGCGRKRSSIWQAQWIMLQLEAVDPTRKSEYRIQSPVDRSSVFLLTNLKAFGHGGFPFIDDLMFSWSIWKNSTVV
jgi:hypothetical protein